MRLGGTTLGYLHLASLSESLDSLARAGYRLVEVSPTPPHLYTPGFGLYERLELKRRLLRLGLACSSINTIMLDPISPNPELAEVARRQILDAIQLAHDLEAPTFVMVPGRRYILQPCPLEDALDALRRQLHLLLPKAERLGVTIALENIPGGILETAGALAHFVDDFGSAWLAIAYDAANVPLEEDPQEGVRLLGERIKIAHISGSWRNRWAHTGIQGSDVDGAAFASALQAINFQGPTIYEIIDGQDPEPRHVQDLELFAEWGWRP